MLAQQAFHLIHDVDGNALGGTLGRATHEVNPGQLCRVVLNDAGKPQIVPCGAADTAGGLLIEQVRQDRKLFLAAVVPPALYVRVNGLPAPPVCVLQVGDQLEIESRCLLHVSIFVRPYLGAPEPEWVGISCPCCTTPIREGARVYECPVCEAVLHADATDVHEQDRLECHLLASECPSCHQPIVLEEGFVYVPDT